jgi:hypothetical protein
LNIFGLNDTVHTVKCIKNADLQRPNPIFGVKFRNDNTKYKNNLIKLKINFRIKSIFGSTVKNVSVLKFHKPAISRKFEGVNME